MTAGIFERRYFEQNYRDYDAQNPARKLQYYARVLERYMDPGVPWRVHDIGCAFGRFLGSLDSRWEICGSDASRFAIEKAERDCPRGHFALANASGHSPFPGTFGAVTAFDVLEHVPDLDAIAASIEKQLCQGGLLVFVVPVYDGLSGPIIRRLDHDETHVHKWPRRHWLDWARARFRILDWRGILRYLLPTGQYLHVATRWCRNHTPAIIVVCRKQ
jgi:SAM-dependent methyltransferase